MFPFSLFLTPRVPLPFPILPGSYLLLFLSFPLFAISHYSPLYSTIYRIHVYNIYIRVYKTKAVVCLFCCRTDDNDDTDDSLSSVMQHILILLFFSLCRRPFSFAFTFVAGTVMRVECLLCSKKNNSRATTTDRV